MYVFIEKKRLTGINYRSFITGSIYRKLTSFYPHTLSLIFYAVKRFDLPYCLDLTPGLQGGVEYRALKYLFKVR